jgi:Ner family transcriptional regulator
MPENKHPEDIKAAVRKTGVSLAELARNHGLDESTTRAALRRPQPSGNRAIAEHLNKPLHELWPEWFDAADNRISCLKDSRPSIRGASQKEKAA